MIVEYIRYKINPEMKAAFQNALEDACRILAESPECLRYELDQNSEDGTLFVWRIEWTSAEAHMEGFRKSAAFARFFALVKPFYQDIQEMQHYDVRMVGTGLALAV